MVWKHSFQWDSESANVLEGYHVIYPLQMKLSSPAKTLFLACYAVSQVKVYRVRVDTVSSHPSSLEVWKYSVTRPPPPTPPPLSFQNYPSIPDKQLHKKRGLRSVNTELLDMIHQWDFAVNNSRPLKDAISAKIEFMKWLLQIFFYN